MMETKGRRALRAAGPIETPTAAERPSEVSTELPQPAEILAEVDKPAETPVNLMAAAVTAAVQSSAATLAEQTKSPSADDLVHFGRDAFAALAESQAALARGLEALSVEMAGLALSGIDTAARTATKMLGVKTLSDAIEVNAGFTCGNLDTLVGSSAKL